MSNELTERERETLRLHGQGWTREQIALAQGVEPTTVSHRLQWCREKLGVVTNEAAYAVAFTDRPTQDA